MKAAPEPAATAVVEGDPAERRAWADALCRRLSEAAAHETTPQICDWEPTWRLVAAPTNALLDALAEYETTGSARSRQRAEELAELVLTAWREAAARWDAAATLFERWAVQHENDPDACTPNRWEAL